MTRLSDKKVRVAGVWLVALLALGVFRAEASEKVLLNIAVDNPVSGWSVLQDSTVYGHGEGLTDIYDGGYQAYTNAGVLEALRRIYVKGDTYIEATVHGMRSVGSAKAFLAGRYKMETGKEAPRSANWDSFTVSESGATTAYAAQGLYVMTVMAYSEGKNANELTAAVMKFLIENAAKLGSSGK